MSQFFTGDIAEVIMYDTALMLEDVDRVGSYLSRKYSLPWRTTTGPVISAVSPSRGPALGGFTVTVLGTGFAGASADQLRIRMAQVNCTGVSMVRGGAAFTAPPGVGYVDIEVIREEVGTFAQGAFRYDAPLVTNIQPSTAPSAGGGVITIFGMNFGRLQDAAIASVVAKDGVGRCTNTWHVSDTSVVCATPAKVFEDAHVVVHVGGQTSLKIDGRSSLAISDIPAHYVCMLDDTCNDCCLSKCQRARVYAGTATGRTHIECARICYDYCRSMLRTASQPTALRVGPAMPTGSTIPLMWDVPADQGGDPISEYEISYTVEGQSETVVLTSSSSTEFVLSGLPANTIVDQISVRGITSFGRGEASLSLSARTVDVVRPSAIVNVRVVEVTGKSITIAWEDPTDIGGEPLSAYKVQYLLPNGEAQTVVVLPSANKVSVADLLPGAELRNISVAAENSVGLGPWSAPIQVARTVISTPPSITNVADTATLAGESTAPQSFFVSDGQTPSEFLVVRAVSNNQELVSNEGIEIGGVGSERFVVVTPLLGVAGSASITVTVVDEEGLSAEMQFTVYASPAWQMLWPTRGYSSGGAQVTVAGSGFVLGANDYVCRFVGAAGTVNGVVVVQSKSRLVCTTPVWTYTAASVSVQILKGSASLDKIATSDGVLKEQAYVFEEVWHSMTPTQAPASGGAVVTITGAGFDTAGLLEYACLFSAAGNFLPSSSVTPDSSTVLRCTVPDWGSLYSAQAVIVSLRRGGVLVPLSTPSLKLLQVHSLRCFSYLILLSLNVVVHVIGYCFSIACEPGKAQLLLDSVF